jgi:hypothetical protein
VKKYLTVTTMLAMLDSTVLLSSFVATSAFAQDAPYNEEYMQQHDGGDRDEYLQEVESRDRPFHEPPTNDDTFFAATITSRPAD